MMQLRLPVESCELWTTFSFSAVCCNRWRLCLRRPAAHYLRNRTGAPTAQAPGSSTCRSCGLNIYQWPELAALSILFRERLVYFFESRPRLLDIISRSIEGVAGLILAGVAVWQVAAR
ncbi:hypothetical protein NKH74_27460 [Mesorhizobium sp. M0933]|uniref:hypothetical protein n=1 Tax=Mesorhizobium sp. M0933 TaxID=2957030 RepID=UPI00333BA15A